MNISQNSASITARCTPFRKICRSSLRLIGTHLAARRSQNLQIVHVLNTLSHFKSGASKATVSASLSRIDHKWHTDLQPWVTLLPTVRGGRATEAGGPSFNILFSVPKPVRRSLYSRRALFFHYPQIEHQCVCARFHPWSSECDIIGTRETHRMLIVPDQTFIQHSCNDFGVTLRFCLAAAGKSSCRGGEGSRRASNFAVRTTPADCNLYPTASWGCILIYTVYLTPTFKN